MNQPVFLHLSSKELADHIHAAKQRVLYCAPGLQQSVAAALVNTRKNLGRENVRVVLDVNDATARMGYGEFDAVTLMTESAVDVRTEPGLRTCVLIVDDTGYAFFTPPMLVEIQDDQHVGINAMSLMPEQVNSVISAIFPPSVLVSPKNTKSATEPETSPAPVPAPTLSLGKEPLTAQTVVQVKIALEANPPQKFDLARKVNVFNSMVEFIELKLKGLQIAKHKVQLPKELMEAISDKETAKRLAASFSLVDGDSSLSKDTKKIESQVKELRDRYLRPLGGLGSVMLKTNRENFEKDVLKIQEDIAELQKQIIKRLEDEINSSRKNLRDSLLPTIQKNIPQVLTLQIPGEVPKDVLSKYLDDKLQQVFPKVENLVSEMKLDWTPKGVTYETLKSPDFQQRVQQAFPYADLEKPFKEFEAVAGQEQHELSAARKMA